MRRLSFALVALIAVLASVAAVASTASAALPKLLPELTKERTWTGESVGTSTLQKLGSSLEVSCKKATAEGTEEASKVLGLFHIHFKECSSLGGLAVCTGLGEENGVILVLGTWHLVWDELSPELRTAILFLIENLVHFTCGGATLVLVLGSVLCLVLEPATKAATKEFHCKNNGTVGDPDVTEYDTETGKAKAELLSSENEGAETMSAEVALGKVTYKEELTPDI